MANAAAKKAAAALASAQATYRPLLLALNVVYILLRLRHIEEALSLWHLVGILCVWILEYVSYQGILDSAASQKSSDTSLAGGVYLDLLGLVLVVQFGSCLVSAKFYWLLTVIPPAAAYKLYLTFQKTIPGPNTASASRESTLTQPGSKKEGSEDMAEKRRKRAERRRQKWS